MDKNQTGISSEFWFFSQLQRLGYESYITLGNTKKIDIAVKLSNGTMLSFDVKGKINFGGSFQYLDYSNSKKKNHYLTFVDLSIKRDKDTNRSQILNNPQCYIMHVKDLHEIAFHWTSSNGNSKGFGFEAKLLWYLKSQDMTSITKKNIIDFRERHNVIGEIDFEKYNRIILSLQEFEDKFHINK